MGTPGRGRDASWSRCETEEEGKKVRQQWWYWQISAMICCARRSSTIETNQTQFDFAKQLCNQSCLEHSSAEPGAMCTFFLQHQFVLAFILWNFFLHLFYLSKLWHAKAVSCQLDHTSEVNAFAYFPPAFPKVQSLTFLFGKYSTIPHVLSSQWFQLAHSPHYFHPHNHISIPVSAFPCPCCCIIWNTLYQHNHAPNTNIINGL